MHLSGVTAALSESCRECLHWVSDQAQARGVRVSFDLNYRAKLWPPDQARAFIEALLPKVDVLFLGDEEARALWNRDDAELLQGFAAQGPKEIVLKRAAHGCSALIDGEFLESPAFAVTELDPVVREMPFVPDTCTPACTTFH